MVLHREGGVRVGENQGMIEESKSVCEVKIIKTDMDRLGLLICADQSSTRDSRDGGYDVRWREDRAKWTGSVTYSKISSDVRSGPSQ